MAFLDDEQTVDAVEELEGELEGDADVVGGEAGEIVDESAVLADGVEGEMTLGIAVNEYFRWEEIRAEKRKAKQANGGAKPKKEAFVLDEAAREAVARFLSHFGPGTAMSELSPKDMEGFQETVGASTTDLQARLQPVKEFLKYCSNKGLTSTTNASGEQAKQNLGNSLRIPRQSATAATSSNFRHEEAQTFEMTQEGLERLQDELTQLGGEMEQAIAAVAAAREDKDIRENAPLEAAREQQARINSRMDELRYQIAHAVVSEGSATGRAQLGSVVEVLEIDAQGGALGEAREYTLVGAAELSSSNAEVESSARRISVDSPLGRGLLDQPPDRQIEIEAPSGVKHFRLISVKG